MSKKKIVLIVILIVLVCCIIAGINVFLKVKANSYELGDYGVSVTLPAEFNKVKTNNESHILYMHGTLSDIVVSATALPLNYWSSGDLDIIMDEYVRLLSSAKYECNFKDVSLEKVTVDGHEIGKIDLTIEYRTKSYRTITYILNEDLGNLAIEIYGKPDTVANNTELIDNIEKSIKIGKNKHNYDNFTVISKSKSGE